jgi:hypothetical protein
MGEMNGFVGTLPLLSHPALSSGTAPHHTTPWASFHPPLLTTPAPSSPPPPRRPSRYLATCTASLATSCACLRSMAPPTPRATSPTSTTCSWVRGVCVCVWRGGGGGGWSRLPMPACPGDMHAQQTYPLLPGAPTRTHHAHVRAPHTCSLVPAMWYTSAPGRTPCAAFPSTFLHPLTHTPTHPGDAAR